MNTASSVVQAMRLLILNSSEPAAISQMNCEIIWNFSPIFLQSGPQDLFPFTQLFYHSSDIIIMLTLKLKSWQWLSKEMAHNWRVLGWTLQDIESNQVLPGSNNEATPNWNNHPWNNKNL